MGLNLRLIPSINDIADQRIRHTIIVDVGCSTPKSQFVRNAESPGRSQTLKGEQSRVIAQIARSIFPKIMKKNACGVRPTGVFL